MNLENIVCSLELAKKLKKLGVEQESLFYWINPQYTNNNIHVLMLKEDTFLREHWPAEDFYFSALTIQELIDKLPNNIIAENNVCYSLEINRFNYIDNIDIEVIPSWIVSYRCSDFKCIEEDGVYNMEPLSGPLIKRQIDANGANLFAQILILLIEKGLYEPDVGA